MNLLQQDKKHLIPEFIVSKKGNSFNNISCEHQDTCEMTNYLLLYFKVHLYLEGLSKMAQAQVLLQVNKRLLIHCIWESQKLPDSNHLLNFVREVCPPLFGHADKARFWYLLGIPFEFSICLPPQLFNRVVYPSPPHPPPPPLTMPWRY